MSTLLRSLKMKTLLITLLLSGTAIAGDFTMAQITNEEDSERTTFILNTDDTNKEIVGFTYKTFNAAGKLVKTTKKSPDGVFSESGIVIEERQDRVIVAFKSDNFATHNGGNIIVDTLYNGATGKRKSYDFELVRAGADWELLYDGKPVSKIHLKSKKLPVVGVVGISEIVVK
ncbi:MAG: hypothetical protein EP319_10770 [Deltaproteobacteria bacterium]|nr:MAG: hypothetical protein EP319_10770 [Deltaproteobacteria bacterium]